MKTNSSEWTREQVGLLGKLPDRKIARKLRRSLSEVQERRLSLKIRTPRDSNRTACRTVEPEAQTLISGPYHPPRTRRGRFLICQRRGKVKVGDHSDATIPWPMKWKTRSLILCGDLVRAVQNECVPAIAYHWGVRRITVHRWRKALGVAPMTSGTIRLKSLVQSQAVTPAVRAHISRLNTGKPASMTRAGRARLLAAVRKPKTPAWFRSNAKYFAARRGKPVNPKHRVWTSAEDRLLGTKPDAQIAKLLNRSICAVAVRRQKKVKRYQFTLKRPWTAAEIALLGTLPDTEVAHRTGHSRKSVQNKRQSLRILFRTRRKSTCHQQRPDITPPHSSLKNAIGIIYAHSQSVS